MLKSIDNANARREVEAQYEEFRRTGKVRATLGEDDKVVRALYATEVLKTPLSSLDAKWPREIGAKAGEGAAPRGKTTKPTPKPAPVAVQAPPPAEKPQKPAKAEKLKVVPSAPANDESEIAPASRPAVAEPPPARSSKELPRELPAGAPLAKRDKTLPRFTLSNDAPVVQAPSIGPKTAKRLEACGVRTISDLLALAPEDGEAKIDARHISAQVIRDWQAQALLACTVPGLRSREAQALVACGVRTSDDLIKCDPVALCNGVAEWGLSDEGQRAWGNAPAPTEDDVATWIERARRALQERSTTAAA